MPNPSPSESRWELPGDPNALLSLRSAAEDAPKSLALATEKQALTYQDLWSLVMPLLVHTSGRRMVALSATLTLETLPWLYACLESKTPLLLLHPAWPGELQREEARKCGATLLVRDGQLLPLDPEEEPSLYETDRILLYTSGTSGRPKVVVHTRDSLIAAAKASARNLPLSPSDRWLLNLTFAHVGGLSVLLRSLIVRSTVVFSDPSMKDDTPPQMLQALRPTLLSLVPTQLARMLDAGAGPPQSVRGVLVGGAPAAPSLRLRARHQGWPILCTYGSTEMGSQIATQSPLDFSALSSTTLSAAALGDPQKISPSAPDQDVGRPLSEVEVRVLASGALEVRGPSRMRGYLREAPLDRDDWLPTFDHGHFDTEGRLFIEGRSDDMIISGGENIHPLRVEGVLCGIEGVLECCVVGAADPKWGQKLIALIVCDQKLAEKADWQQVLADQAGKILPKYMIPKAWILCSELPKTALLKLDRKAALLRAQAND